MFISMTYHLIGAAADEFQTVAIPLIISLYASVYGKHKKGPE